MPDQYELKEDFYDIIEHKRIRGIDHQGDRYNRDRFGFDCRNKTFQNIMEVKNNGYW